MQRYFFPLLLGLVGAAILIGLGLWQLQRLAWKEGILAEIDATITAAPVAVPDVPNPETDRYLPVSLTGTTGPKDLHVLISQKVHGAGFRIVTAFEAESGRRFLLDRGFVPITEKDAPRPPINMTVVGNLHWPDDRDGFTPENDPATNYWYARDLAPMAEALDTEPFLIVVRSTSETDPSVTPLPLDTAGIPNNHLGYAVQWFGLALVWLGMTAFLIRRIARRTT